MERSAKISVAILGATGYIGRSLTATAGEHGFEASPFSRDAARATEVFSSYGIDVASVSSYDAFLDQRFDIVINATGVGSPKEIAKDPSKVFAVTEAMDALVFSYLEKYSDTQVFAISSGSVYGLAARQPVGTGALATFDPACLGSGDNYSLAKLYSEAKHRARSGDSIIDLRVFAFISRWLDPEESFFIAEAAKRLLEGETFHTRADDMVRDYCTADDIWRVIEFLYEKPAQNSAFDMQSKSPVAKFELLEKLSERFGLHYEVSGELADQSPTGQKNAYYSKSDALLELGYVPERTSLQNIEHEIESLLEHK